VEYAGQSAPTNDRRHPRRIECGKGADRGAQETVPHPARIFVGPQDQPRRGDAETCGALPSARARPRSLEGRELAVRGAQVAVIHVVRVYEAPRDRPLLVHAPSLDSTLPGACARARRIELGDFAVRGAHEAVIHIARVNVPSRDRPARDDAEWKSALTGVCARARNIERDDGGLVSACGKAQPQHAQGQAKGERSPPSDCRTELVKSNMVCHDWLISFWP